MISAGIDPCPGGTTQITPGACFVSQWGTRGINEGSLWYPAGTGVDSSGNVYVADGQNHRIQEFTGAGAFVRMWGWGVDDGTAAFQSCTSGCQRGISGSGNGQFTSPSGITTDASGNVYVADTWNHRIEKYDSSGNFLFNWGSQGSGYGSFFTPIGIATNSAGDLFVADQNNNRVQKFLLANLCPGGTTLVVTGVCYVTLVGGYGADDGDFLYPAGAALDSLGNVYVADTMNNRIQKFDNSLVFQSKWGTAGNGEFFSPAAIDADSSGDIYVADANNYRVQKFTSSGAYITQWGGFGSSDGQFRSFFGLAVDGAGNVYVADTMNARIQKFSSTGTFLLKWGGPGSGFGQFSSPQGLAVDSDGNVYVADTNNNNIQKFSFDNPCPGGTTQITLGVCYVTQWGTSGSGNGEFSNPGDIAVDAANNIYVADQANSRIQKFTNGGAYLAQWGTGGTGEGEFDMPRGLSVDSTGNVQVVDQNNHRIQKFTSTGTFLDKWGSYGHANGQFSSPSWIAVFGESIFVMDTENHRIQKFGMSGVFLPLIIKNP